MYSPSGYVHRSAPVAALSAYVRRFSVAKYTRPDTIVGEPEIGPFALNDHFTSPVAASKQKSEPEYEPAYTRCRQTAEDEYT